MDAYDKDELAAYIAFLAKFALVDSEIDDEEMIFLLALVEAAQLPQEVNDRLCRFIDSTTSEANDMAAMEGQDTNVFTMPDGDGGQPAEAELF